MKLLVSLLSQTCERLVGKKRREKQRCTGQLDFSLVSCSILYSSDCVGLYHRTILNYFNPLKVYLIINSRILDNGPSGEGFTETCPVYRYSYAVVHEPSLQVFWYRHSFIMFNCLDFYSSFFLMLWSVNCLSWYGCSYSYTNITAVLRYLHPGLPEGAFLGFIGCWRLAVDRPLFSDCMVHLIYDVLTLPIPKLQTCCVSPDPL